MLVVGCGGWRLEAGGEMLEVGSRMPMFDV